MGRRLIEKARSLVRRGNRRRLRLLLRKHPYLLRSDEALLVFYACWFNRGMLAWLLEHGVDPDSRLEEADGNTPLMQAAGDGDVAVMTTLLEHGASIKTKNESGEVPLGFAVTYEQPEAIRLLAAHGADINGTEGSGQTHLDWAILSGWEETAEALRSLGARRMEEISEGG